MKDYFEPEFGKEAFNCPYCEVYAHQVWRLMLSSYNSDKNNGARYTYDN